jgi:prepilin signal peptidase PulO-like enzyme (type II secretory pathway)
MRRSLFLPVVAFLVCPSDAFACGSHTPTRYSVVPGAAFFVAPWMGLILPVLYAVLERPFYSRAGFHEKTIWYSLQANFVATWVTNTAGAALLFVSANMLKDEITLGAFSVLAVGSLAAGVKWMWFWRVPRDPAPAGSGAIFWAASLFSALVGLSLLFWMWAFGFDTQNWAYSIRNWIPWATLAAFVGSIGVVVVAFRKARRTPKHESMPEPRGFEVLNVHEHRQPTAHAG